jgi:hypothetical protein
MVQRAAGDDVERTADRHFEDAFCVIAAGKLNVVCADSGVNPRAHTHEEITCGRLCRADYCDRNQCAG